MGAPLGAAGLGDVARAGDVAARVSAALQSVGYEVQTTRLASPALHTLVGGASEALRLALDVERAAKEAGFGYVALGAIDTFSPHAEALLRSVPEIVERTESVFCAATVATRERGINVAATRTCGKVIATIAAQTSDGFGNLRFAALANCPPHVPFFPAAYHDGADRLTVGLALEAADLAVEAFDGAASLDDARRRLVHSLSRHVDVVRVAALAAITGERDVALTGVDLSLAPFPADDRSIANAFERVGVPAFGAHGTLFVASFMTDCLRAAGERFGFSGLMLPVLEDSVLAERAAQGVFGVDSLLLYSAVCGLGLDTVPLPGDTSPAELGAILLDVAALAVKLDKPLTARLFPVPGKVAGDAVSWDFAFFSPSRVLAVRGLGPRAPLSEAATYNPAQ